MATRTPRRPPASPGSGESPRVHAWEIPEDPNRLRRSRRSFSPSLRAREAASLDIPPETAPEPNRRRRRTGQSPALKAMRSNTAADAVRKRAALLASGAGPRRRLDTDSQEESGVEGAFGDDQGDFSVMSDLELDDPPLDQDPPQANGKRSHSEKSLKDRIQEQVQEQQFQEEEEEKRAAADSESDSGPRSRKRPKTSAEEAAETAEESPAMEDDPAEAEVPRMTPARRRLAARSSEDESSEESSTTQRTRRSRRSTRKRQKTAPGPAARSRRGRRQVAAAAESSAEEKEVSPGNPRTRRSTRRRGRKQQSDTSGADGDIEEEGSSEMQVDESSEPEEEPTMQTRRRSSRRANGTPTASRRSPATVESFANSVSVPSRRQSSRRAAPVRPAVVPDDDSSEQGQLRIFQEPDLPIPDYPNPFQAVQGCPKDPDSSVSLDFSRSRRRLLIAPSENSLFSASTPFFSFAWCCIYFFFLVESSDGTFFFLFFCCDQCLKFVGSKLWTSWRISGASSQSRSGT